MDQDTHTAMLQARLPEGSIWETEDGEDFYALLRSLSGSPETVDDAMDQHLEDFLPDTCGVTGTYIPDWARLLDLPQSFESDAWDGYTDAQKQAVIIAQLQNRGDPNLPNVQDALRELFDDATIVLTQGEHPSWGMNVSGCTDGIGDEWVAVWTLRYMDRAITPAQDDFAAWDTPGTVVNNAAQSPVTLALTADKVTPGGGDFVDTAINGTANGDTVRATVWFRSADTAKEITVRVKDRAGAIVASLTTDASPTLWQKASLVVEVGTGGSDPLFQIFWDTGGDLYLSGAGAGIAQPATEARAQTMVPFVTTGEFFVKGEDEP